MAIAVNHPEARATKREKLAQLAEIEGICLHDAEQLEEIIMDSVCPGICKHRHCDFTTEVEPDCRSGYCENCGTHSVWSLQALLGII